MKTETCKIVSKGGYLQLAMPNGELLPKQTDMTISNPLHLSGSEDNGVFLSVTVQVRMTADEFIEMFK